MKKLIPAFSVILAALLYLVFPAEDPASEEERAIPASLAFKIEDSGKEGIVPGGYVNVKVTKVVDGDTVNVKYGKKDYKVRLLCVDAPESVKSGLEPQPFAADSSEMTERLVSGKRVRLVFDKGLYDRYGRLLAFMLLENGECVNGLLVYGGYARVEIVAPNKTYGDWFYKLQSYAISKGSGLWALAEKKRPFVKDGNGGYIPRYLESAS